MNGHHRTQRHDSPSSNEPIQILNHSSNVQEYVQRAILDTSIVGAALANVLKSLELHVGSAGHDVIP